MGISFKGRDVNSQYWVFNIDGRDFVALDASLYDAAGIWPRFTKGRYVNWGNTPLVQHPEFSIFYSTSQTTSNIGEKQGVVEWIWDGAKYKSSWNLIAGEEIIPGDPSEGIESVWDYQLTFFGRVPFDGPTGGAVGTGIVSQATIVASAKLSTDAPVQQSPIPMENTRDRATTVLTPGTTRIPEILLTQSDVIVPSVQLSTAAPEQASPRPVGTGIVSQAVIQAQQAASATAVEETKDALLAANKALAYSESRGTVNIEALNTARIELKNAKDALAAAESRSTQGQTVLMSQLREQVEAIQEKTDIQIKIYQQMVVQAQKAAQTTGGGVVTGGGTTTGGGTPPTTTPALVTTDWVKLGLQLGAAYLLLT